VSSPEPVNCLETLRRVHPLPAVVKPVRAHMHPSVFRQIRLATFAFLALVVVALVLSAALSVREQRRLRDAHAELMRFHQFERIHLIAERRLTLVVQRAPGDQRAVDTIGRQIDRMMALAGDPQTSARLQTLRSRLQQPTTDRVELAHTLVLFNEADDLEQERQQLLLKRLEGESAIQLRLEMAAPLAILAIGLLLFPVARRRIIKPLDAFGRQLTRLADGEFTPAPVDSNVDPFLLPLHRQFNALAHRLQELEASHRDRAASLESAVRAATGELLAQQRHLARAERLAATGELAASIAHELRNPLAGLQMTLSNLRTELPDPELKDRADLMIEEVGRLTRLLNQLLDTARHEPERPQPIRLAELVDDIITLNRYQLAPALHFDRRIDPDLTLRLPPDRLRQALLNLILNAGAALGDAGGTISIDAAVEGSTVRITVADDGPGFPPELLRGGIRPFFSTRDRGTGLGLAMVRRFARDVGGTIDLANVAPHGARITLTLPTEIDHA
jgi:two-component system NtrC family sensor kinase